MHDTRPSSTDAVAEPVTIRSLIRAGRAAGWWLDSRDLMADGRREYVWRRSADQVCACPIGDGYWWHLDVRSGDICAEMTGPLTVAQVHAVLSAVGALTPDGGAR